MDIRYTLSMKDHLAWYDHYLAAPEGSRFRSSLPFVGGILDKFRRWRYSCRLIFPFSRHAFGERTLEATQQGLREFSPKFCFTTAWSDLGLVVATSSHLFLAHRSMNAYIVPLRCFQSDAARESFIAFAQSHFHRNAA